MCGHIKEIEKVQSPARINAPPQKRSAVVRTESAEAQEYVSEPQGFEEKDEEEMEELSFVPSAVSEPRWALHICDNKCNKEGYKFHQLAAVVTEEGGGKAHTIILCKQCFWERRLKQGEQAATAARWREIVEQKAFRGKLWVAFGMAQHVRRMWGHFTFKKAWTRSVLSDADKEEARRERRVLAKGVAVQRGAGACQAQ